MDYRFLLVICGDSPRISPMKQPQLKVSAKMARYQDKQHVGPGSKIVSMYCDMRLHERIKVRANSLNLSASQYISQLVRQDLSAGKDYLVVKAKDQL